MSLSTVQPASIESPIPMRSVKTTFSSRSLANLARMAVVMGTIGLLAGCANRDNMTTGSIPDDYRARHPITLTEVEHSIEVPIASGERKLTQGMRDVIAGFAADYRQRATGSVQMFVPHGAYNSGAAQGMRKEIRSVLAANGVPMPKIIETSYQAGAQDNIAPIRLTYVAMSAVTEPCGNWPADLMNPATIENRNWHNFGCASQNNLAAQVENPMDLVAPRKMAPIDATQRANVISTYRTAPSASE